MKMSTGDKLLSLTVDRLVDLISWSLADYAVCFVVC